MDRIMRLLMPVTIAGLCVVLAWAAVAIVDDAWAAGRSESPVWHGSRPGDGSAAVTPNDSTDLAQTARSLYITAGGAVKFTAMDGTVDTWTVPDSFYLNVQVTRVWSAGTTATGIHALY